MKCTRQIRNLLKIMQRYVVGSIRQKIYPSTRS